MVETNDIGELKALIHSLLAEVERLKARVNELETENAALRTRLAQNLANSHKPPASDGYQKKPLIKPALPKEVGKNRAASLAMPVRRSRWSTKPTSFIATSRPIVANVVLP